MRPITQERVVERIVLGGEFRSALSLGVGVRLIDESGLKTVPTREVFIRIDAPNYQHTQFSLSPDGVDDLAKHLPEIAQMAREQDIEVSDA